MISRRTSSVPKEDVVFPRLLYCDSRCSQTCHWRFQVLPGISSALTDMSPAHPAALRLVVGEPRLVAGAPRLVAGTPRCSQVHTKFSPALRGVPKTITITSMAHIRKKYFRPGGMAASEWTRPVRAVRDTPVVYYSVPGIITMHCAAYRPPIAVSPFLLALSLSCFKHTLWRCGHL